MDATVHTSEKKNAQVQDAQKLSKFGQWRLDNPGGIGYIKDRRTINRMTG